MLTCNPENVYIVSKGVIGCIAGGNLRGSGVFVRLGKAAARDGETSAADALVECWGPAFKKGAPCAALQTPLTELLRAQSQAVTLGMLWSCQASCPGASLVYRCCLIAIAFDTRTSLAKHCCPAVLCMTPHAAMAHRCRPMHRDCCHLAMQMI